MPLAVLIMVDVNISVLVAPMECHALAEMVTDCIKMESIAVVSLYWIISFIKTAYILTFEPN